MTPQELEQLTFRSMPEAFLRAALQSVFLAHRQAWDDCRSQFAQAEAENVMGYYRRGKLEGYLRDAADRFPSLTATATKADHSGWYHTEIRGGPVVLTENSVQAPCALVEKADFRLGLAESNQLALWENMQRRRNSNLYVLLLHSRSVWETIGEKRKFGHLPGSTYVAYPAPTLDHYLHEINLFDRFPDVVAANMPKEWSVEAQARYVRRARRSWSA